MWLVNKSNTNYFNYRTVRHSMKHLYTYYKLESIYFQDSFLIRHANYIETEFDFLSTAVIQSETCELKSTAIEKSCI